MPSSPRGRGRSRSRSKTPRRNLQTSQLYVAFDLDRTLGAFDLTNALAYFWSAELITNPEQAEVNDPTHLSVSLTHKLASARKHFAARLLEHPDLLDRVLRPNLDTIMSPLLKLKKEHKLGAVVIYSNTGVTDSMHLAKALIEKKFHAPRFFQVLADHWHPLREKDRQVDPADPDRYIEPLKQVGTLQLLFREAGAKTPVPLSEILFVDDRPVKHAIQEGEAGGLTYIMPKIFIPHITKEERMEILNLALEALEEEGLLKSSQYLNSPFCQRNIRITSDSAVAIENFDDLLMFVRERVEQAESAHQAWRPDTEELAAEMDVLLQKFH